MLLQVETFNFSDIFKKSFLEGWGGQQTDIKSVVISLLITTILALYLFFVYRVMTRKTFYSKEFNISLAGVSLITSAIIVTIQSNIVISLGMVGALSIVRFRTAIKNPMDLMFLFWAVSIGIICGAGLAVYAIALSVLLTICVILLNFLPIAKAPMILIVNSKNLNSENEIMKCVSSFAKHTKVRARNISSTQLSLTIELRTADGGDLVKSINNIDDIISVSLLTHDGEVTFVD